MVDEIADLVGWWLPAAVCLCYVEWVVELVVVELESNRFVEPLDSNRVVELVSVGEPDGRSALSSFENESCMKSDEFRFFSGLPVVAFRFLGFTFFLITSRLLPL